jgi:parallel beta-helix repeat protein
MKFVLEKPKLLALVGFLMFYSLPSQAATINVACPGQSLQAAVDGAQPGDTIQVSGTCTENIVVRNEKQRLAISGFATINGPDASLPTINVRGKGILIQGLVITGGKSGVHVNRGSNAVIHSNTIDSSDYGIQLDQQSFAVVTNNTISGNVYGVFVDESSTVRVGYNLETDTSASPNNIISNSVGIVIKGNSNAKIAGNTISGNSLLGIAIVEQSHAVIGGNNIGNNGFNGIEANLNSSADLAAPALAGGPSFLSTVNNSNAGNNGSFGVACGNGGYVRGLIGSLSGIDGPKTVSAPCQDLL